MPAKIRVFIRASRMRVPASDGSHTWSEPDHVQADLPDTLTSRDAFRSLTGVKSTREVTSPLPPISNEAAKARSGWTNALIGRIHVGVKAVGPVASVPRTSRLAPRR